MLVGGGIVFNKWWFSNKVMCYIVLVDKVIGEWRYTLTYSLLFMLLIIIIFDGMNIWWHDVSWFRIRRFVQHENLLRGDLLGLWETHIFFRSFFKFGRLSSKTLLTFLTLCSLVGSNLLDNRISRLFELRSSPFRIVADPSFI